MENDTKTNLVDRIISAANNIAMNSIYGSGSYTILSKEAIEAIERYEIYEKRKRIIKKLLE
jgi:hypothetical protein